MEKRAPELIVDSWLEKIDRWVSYSWVIFPLAGLFVAWEVMMRYFFNSPHSWFEEISIFVCVLASFLGSSRTTWENQHINIDMLYMQLKGRGRRILDMIIFIAISGTCVALIVTLWIYAAFLDRQGITYQSGLASPYSVLAYILILGMLLNLIFSIRFAFRTPPRFEGGPTAIF